MRQEIGMCALRGHAKVIVARARLERTGTGTGNGGGTRTDSDDDGNPDEWAEGAPAVAAAGSSIIVQRPPQARDAHPLEDPSETAAPSAVRDAHPLEDPSETATMPTGAHASATVAAAAAAAAADRAHAPKWT
ncbi:hypothetical protein T492DRAFT_869284 [Pavlovales sp. CCMP2436]|nr:hypothetical protein T492DRAFT_869284 [Pavlovales sp. CCMP2436]